MKILTNTKKVGTISKLVGPITKYVKLNLGFYYIIIFGYG